MRRSINMQRTRVLVALAAALLIAFQPAAAQAAKPTVGRPFVSTGSVGHTRHNASTVLEGAVNPDGAPTTYYFQFGPSAVYGKVTATQNLPAGTAKVKVRLAATGLLQGYHYRLVATNAYGTSTGRDAIYGSKKATSPFVLPTAPEPTVYGQSFVLAGTLATAGNVGRTLVLQASPYPYERPFADVGAPVVTNALGHFSFRVPKLTTSTEFRVSTVGPGTQISSPVVIEHVIVRVTLHVRSKGPKGLVRVYGTVTPAEVGSEVLLQFRKPVRRQGGKSERTTTFVTRFRTVAKRATRTMSRFSAVVTIVDQGRYRAYVAVKKGSLGSGTSASVVLAAAPPTIKKTRGKRV